MDMDTISQFIQTVGFPIAAYAALFWYVIQNNKRNDEREDTQNAAHKAEVEKLTEALNNNTLAIQRLVDHIAPDDEYIKGKHSA